MKPNDCKFSQWNAAIRKCAPIFRGWLKSGCYEQKRRARQPAKNDKAKRLFFQMIISSRIGGAMCVITEQV
jgi:hypothetical protein